MASMLIGSVGELHFEEVLIERGGADFEKISDSDLENRYDYSVLIDTRDFVESVEVKVASETSSVSIGFRDKRNVHLPSGQVWSTGCRKTTEDFTWLATCMFNLTGNWKDFCYLPFSSIPLLKTTTKTGKVLKNFENYSAEDRAWIEANYLASTVKIPQKLSRPVVTSLG
jgi:hypothetical protein